MKEKDMEEKDKRGIVYLIGAGPGDPKLMTLWGKECLQKADVVIYDYLANQIFLSWTRPEAKIYYVGKKGGTAHIQQEEINELILKTVQEGKIVARLKGGDPFIFGRGGEEAEVLADQGIPFEIVPGITSAISVPAYAGIPLTHRRFTSTVAFITGHEDPGKDESEIEWEKLATGVGTLVFLMSMSRLPHIVAQLQKYGLSPSTAVAVIQWGTLPEQKTLVADLQSVVQRVSEEGLGAPSIVVVGEVVKLRQKLQWLEKRPLFGKTILVTRARAQSSIFSQGLQELGARVIEFPTIRIARIGDFEAIDHAIEALSTYQWVIFTSSNGVDFFFQRLNELGKDSRAIGNSRICAIGPETAASLQQRSIRPDYIPLEYVAESLVAGLVKFGLAGSNILIPRALEARDILPDRLRESGASVTVVPIYETLPDEGDVARILELVKSENLSMITFTSTSTVKNFAAAFQKPDQQVSNLFKQVDVACIGPICAKEAESLGLSVSLIPEQYTIPDLTEAIVRYYQQGTSPSTSKNKRP